MKRRTRAPVSRPCDLEPHGCEISELFRILSRAHMLDVLHLFVREDTGPRRFVEVQDLLHVSPNTLSERLRELVEAGLLSRTAYNEIPPRVDYEATTKGRELVPVFESLAAWAARNTLTASTATREAPQAST